MVVGRARFATVAWRSVGAIVLALTMIACAAFVAGAPGSGADGPTAAAPERTAPPVTGVPDLGVPSHLSQPVARSGSPAFSTLPAVSVVRTVFPGFNTSLSGSFTSSVSAWEVGSPAYVPSTDTIWFPQRSVTISGIPFPSIAPAAVFNLATKSFDQLVTNLSNASALAYDPGNGFLYATEPGTDSVAVINPVTDAIVKPSIPVGSDPDAIAFDPSSNNIFVANHGSANVTVIDALDNQVYIGNVPVGTNPTSLVDDSIDGLIFVANAGTKAVSVITAANPSSPQPSVALFWGQATGLSYSPESDNVIATIPSSAYATIIHANPVAVVTSVKVGQGVSGAATSENGTEFVLGNSTGGDVVVLNSTFGTQIGLDIPMDRNVTQVVLDPLTGNAYCWTSISRVVELVDLSTNTALAVAPSTSPQLVSISSPTGQGRVFASTGNESLVLPLGPLRLTLSSPGLATSSPTFSVATNSASERLYLGTTNGLKVYNSTTDQLVGSVSGLTGDDTQLVLDPSENLLWLVDSLSGVSAVNLATNQVWFTTGLLPPSRSSEAIAVAPGHSEAFVLVSSSAVAVLDSLTGHVVNPSIPVGHNVTSIAYDPVDDQVYSAGDQVTLLNASSLTIDGSPILLGGPHQVLGEAYEPSRVGIFIATVGLLAGLQGSVTELNGASIPASEGSAVEIPVGEDPDAFGIVTAQSDPVPGSAMVWVANELSGTISVITSPPDITNFAASPATLDLGFPTSITLAYQGGAGVSSVRYYGLPPGCVSANVLRLNCTPSATGVFSLAANVTDSFGYSTNVTTTLTVLRSLAIRTTFSPSTFPEIDPGIPLVGNASASNGLPPYSFLWWFGDGSTASGRNASHAYTRPGTYVITTEVKDLTGASNNTSTAVIVVSPPTIAVSLEPRNVTDVNFPVQFEATVTGGTGESEEGWTFGDGTSLVQLNASHAWTRPGNFSVTFAYTDSLGLKANRTVLVTVHPSLTATFASGNSSSSNLTLPGTPVPFRSSVAGGTPPYLVTWAFGDGSFATGLSVNHSYALAGRYSIDATLTDAVGAGVRTNLTVSVSQNTSVTNTTSSLPALTGNFGPGLFLGLLVGGVLAAAVLLVAGSRKRGRPPAEPMSPYVPP